MKRKKFFNVPFSVVFQGNTRDEILANRLMDFLMKNCFHAKRAVFRHNLEIIRTIVECWKDCLRIPYEYDITFFFLLSLVVNVLECASDVPKDLLATQ